MRDLRSCVAAALAFVAAACLPARAGLFVATSGDLAASVDFSNNLRAGLYVQYMPSDAYPIRDEFLAALAADLGGDAKAAALG